MIVNDSADIRGIYIPGNHVMIVLVTNYVNMQLVM